MMIKIQLIFIPQNLLRYLIMIFCTFTSAIGSSLYAQGRGGEGKDAYTTITSTKFDFSEESIGGERKTLDRFVLEGRNPQSLSQLIRLRAHFKKELKQSGPSVDVLPRKN